MPTLDEVRRRALRAIVPPRRIQLSAWLEENLILPEGTSALPGRIRLWPYQREIADAIGDPAIERVTLVKPVRVGFTTLLSGAIASYIANDPAPIIVLQPTESDVRDYVVSDLEPICEATPAVAGLMGSDSDEGERNTLAARRFPGGSLKVLAAKAPRNFRRHTARVVMIDEADAMAPTPEGSPLTLIERRTLSYADRKIIVGSTPVDEETSNVLRCYGASDQRVLELPCPECHVFTQILWGHIAWDEGRPETAVFVCPACQARVPERAKHEMVLRGRWRRERPDVVGHAGFRLNALVSLLANASWGKLAAEFVKAKDSPEELQTFVNTILAQGWSTGGGELDEVSIAMRAEPFGLEAIPAEVLIVTVGADVQDDRIEATIVGFSRTDVLPLAHIVIWGSPDEDATWAEMDELLRTRWKHPHGGTLRVDAAVVDSSDEPDRVYSFCFPRLARRIWAGKGQPGSRPAIVPSKAPVRGGRLFLIGVDTLKSSIYDRLKRGQGLRFSKDLEPVYFEQLVSERPVIRYRRGQPVRGFERIKGRPAEALDCLVYAMAARAGLQISLEAREQELQGGDDRPPPQPSIPGRSVSSVMRRRGGW